LKEEMVAPMVVGKMKWTITKEGKMEKTSVSRRKFLAIAGMTGALLALDMKKMTAFAKKIGPKKDYPTVIIGAGLGGLTCAAYLARQGIPVTVLEKHGLPGGYATAFDRAGGKFSFEVSLHGMTAHNNNTERILKDLGIWDKINLVKLPEIVRIKTGSEEFIIPQEDPEGYIQLLSQRFPAESEGIRSFVNEMIGVYEETEKYGRKRLSPRAQFHDRSKRGGHPLDELAIYGQYRGSDIWI
jgi:prolycopene isomerase